VRLGRAQRIGAGPSVDVGLVDDPVQAPRATRLHPPRNLRHVPDRIVDVGLAHRDRVHFAAMRAVHVERHGPGVTEAFHVGQNAGVGLLPGLGTGKEE
jgi:hypothetical protein